MSWYAMLIPACLLMLWFLHSNGFMYMQSKSALTFTGDGKGRKNRMGFSFTRCNGHISRVLKIKEGGLYRFDLDADLSAGGVQFQLLDGRKQPILNLDPDTTRGRVQLEKGARYFVKMQFIHASGGCAASWVKE